MKDRKGHMEKTGSETPAMEKSEEKAKERKRGGMVPGKHPGHRLDKRARGGAMTPSSPLSPAGKMKEMPFEHPNEVEISHAKGKDRD